MASAKGRLDGTRFAVLVFTNLTQDHLDFHGTMEEYFESKRRLFAQADRAVVNVGDEYGQRLAAELPRRRSPFGHGDALGELDLKLPGRFNVENALAAVAAARALGIGEKAIKQGIEAVDRVPGRFDRVDEGQPFTVFVDYAHTPGALETALEAARELGRGGRVICVFGAGGDRDRAKRPLMGQVVAELADLSLVTSDNPRSEDPAAIAAEVVDGLDLEVELDRRRAIERALELARPGDVVVIAGKGHEQGQEIGGRKLPFDDRAGGARGVAPLGGADVIALETSVLDGLGEVDARADSVHRRAGRLAAYRLRRSLRCGRPRLGVRGRRARARRSRHARAATTHSRRLPASREPCASAAPRASWGSPARWARRRRRTSSPR